MTVSNRIGEATCAECDQRALCYYFTASGDETASIAAVCGWCLQEAGNAIRQKQDEAWLQRAAGRGAKI